MEHLTTENFPLALVDASIDDRDIEYIDEELIEGKSIVRNRVGTMFIYMADDKRKKTPQQIIVKELGRPNLHFLPIESKRAFKLKVQSYAL